MKNIYIGLVLGNMTLASIASANLPVCSNEERAACMSQCRVEAEDEVGMLYRCKAFGRYSDATKICERKKNPCTSSF